VISGAEKGERKHIKFKYRTFPTYMAADIQLEKNEDMARRTVQDKEIITLG